MKSIFVFYFLLLRTLCNAQEEDSNSLFSNYLIQNKLYEDNITFLKTKKLNLSCDVIDYRLARTYYLANNFDSSFVYYSNFFGNEKRNSESRLLSSFYLLNKKEYDKSRELLSLIDNSDTCLIKIFNESISVLEASQNYKIKHRFDVDSLSNCTEFSRIKMINQAKITLNTLKNKKPILGGVFSAIIPGLGRIYAGKSTQGLMSFFPVIALGYQAYEAYKIGGVKNARFIVFSSLFSIFYIGNIWGSALSVNVKKQEVYDQVSYEIVANLRLSINNRFFRSK